MKRFTIAGDTLTNGQPSDLYTTSRRANSISRTEDDGSSSTVSEVEADLSVATTVPVGPALSERGGMSWSSVITASVESAGSSSTLSGSRESVSTKLDNYENVRLTISLGRGSMFGNGVYSTTVSSSEFLFYLLIKSLF